jgi:hypothetical protein
VSIALGASPLRDVFGLATIASPSIAHWVSILRIGVRFLDVIGFASFESRVVARTGHVRDR